MKLSGRAGASELRSATAATAPSTLPQIIEARDGCLPDTIAADLLLWLRSMRLSSVGERAAKSVAAWRRAFSSGFLFAELLDTMTARARGSVPIEMHSFQPRVSSEDKKKDNWRLLLPLLKKRCGIKLKIDMMEVLRIIRARQGAAAWLLEQMYRSFILRGLAPETPRLRRGGSMPPAPMPPGTTDQNRMSPLTKRRTTKQQARSSNAIAANNSSSIVTTKNKKKCLKKAIMNKMSAAAAPIGTPGAAFSSNGKISADDATKLFKAPQSTAIAVGKIPLF